MMINMDQLAQYGKGIASGLLFLVIMYGGAWIKKVFDQKKRNTLNEIDLSARKISLDIQSKPIEQLVRESNASHGVNEMEPPPGSVAKKGDEGAG